MRFPGFCDAWNALIKIGLTDGSFPILETNNLTYHALMEAYLPSSINAGSVKERVAEFLGEAVDSPVMQRLDWLGLFRKRRINMERATPALLLENLLRQKWQMKPTDKDLVVMQHEFEYEMNAEKHLLTSTLVIKGDNSAETAMSKLVGLPMGILTKMVMLGEVTATGVNIPVMPEVYEPVLKELEDFDVQFTEKHHVPVA